MPLMIERPDAAAPLAGYYDDLIEAEQEFYIPAATENFVSTGILANDEFTSVLDGDPVIRSFKNMTINENHIVRPTNRCKGMFIYVEGDLIVNGQLTMTARGAKVEGRYIGINPAERRFYFHPTDIFPENFVKIGASGGAGGTRRGGGTSSYYRAAGNGGGVGANGACGGGGSGACTIYNCTSYSGAGSAGTSFSGGAGGGASSEHQYNRQSQGAAANGGAGGRGYSSWDGTHSRGAGGGAGNPGGYTHLLGSGSRVNGGEGTGGLIVLIVRGNIFIGTNGSIQSHGSPGGSTNAHTDGRANGGGSGGGAIHVIHRGTINDVSKIVAIGGTGAGSWGGYAGGKGGDGTVNIVQI